jgi:3-hydroxyisobutyrate dehydrogenase-like beta-hydroxyacid dehydrogenase
MSVEVVGLLSPGDMGSAIASVLHNHGLRVITHLAPRSSRTRSLAEGAGVQDVPSLDDLVQQAQIILSVLVPAQAQSIAAEVARAIETTGARPLYVDCNAIAPRTVRKVGETIMSAGGQFADAGIIGSPPRGQSSPRFYASGTGASGFARLAEFGLDIRVIGEEIGSASGLKMCYGALTKGLAALGAELLVAADRMGLAEILRKEQLDSVTVVLTWLQRSLPTMPPKAHRWVGEMEEIAKCFEDLGLTPNILDGAADMYRFIADTSIGRESPETRDPSRDMDGIVGVLSQALSVNTAPQ